MWYDRQGKPIDAFPGGVMNAEALLHVERLLTDPDYKIVAKTDIAGYEVSTVWLGTDHNFGFEGPPIIFETMLFGDGPYSDWTWRYATEEEAQTSHDAIVKALQEGREPEC